MNELVKQINSILMDWKSKYDLSYDIPLQFVLDEEQRLCWNGKPISLVGEPELESASFGAEHIVFYLSNNCRIYINMAWPEDAAPRVESVLLGYIF